MTSVALPKDGASKALESTFVPALLRVERSRDFPTTHSFLDASFIQSLALSTHLLLSKRELHSVASRSWCSAASEKAATRRRPASSTRLRTPGAPQRRCATRGPTAPSRRSASLPDTARTRRRSQTPAEVAGQLLALGGHMGGIEVAAVEACAA